MYDRPSAGTENDGSSLFSEATVTVDPTGHEDSGRKRRVFGRRAGEVRNHAESSAKLLFPLPWLRRHVRREKGNINPTLRSTRSRNSVLFLWLFTLTPLVSLRALTPCSATQSLRSWTGVLGSSVLPARTLAQPYRPVKNAISQYPLGASWCCPGLAGTKYLTLGGGNSAGVFNEAALTATASSVANITSAGYEGVMFDVEEVQRSSGTSCPPSRTPSLQ